VWSTVQKVRGAARIPVLQIDAAPVADVFEGLEAQPGELRSTPR
jgi:hypothetical protein